MIKPLNFKEKTESQYYLNRFRYVFWKDQKLEPETDVEVIPRTVHFCDLVLDDGHDHEVAKRRPFVWVASSC